jgi:serine/threonine-protein kinase
VRHCPVCQRVYEEDARFCPIDGTRLEAPRDPVIGKILQGQFEVREVCGRGSMGTVYRAWQRSMDREVAIKLLRRDLMRDPRVIKRFHREAKASARLSHPSIITVYMVGDTEDGVPFIAMEYVKGRALDRALTEDGVLPPARAIHIAKQITSALAEAHGQGIVHRDLKPENIFLAEASHTPDFVKILDFGIAKILHAHDESMLTQTGAIFGTPFYLSPEQASGSEIDHRCDLYALGVILFRMVTGRLPFQSDSGMAVLIQHLKEAPPRPTEIIPTLPAPLEHVILKALEKAPDDRWQSAVAMGEALAGVASYLDPLRAVGTTPATGALSATLNDAPALDASSARRQPEPRPEQARAPRAPERAPASDPATTNPRFRVPTDSEIVDGGVLTGAPIEPVPTTPRSEPSPLLPRPSITLALANNVLGRRRLLIHLLTGIGSILGGSALGAALFYRDRRRAEDPVAAPDAGVTQDARPPAPERAEAARPDATPGPDTAAPRPPRPVKKAPRLPAATRPAIRKRPVRKKTELGPSVKPVGPDPGTSGSDHDDPTPKPSPKQDDPYDLVD